jgi:signal transduction histidine kinase/CheY-like chemotaxis protein
LSASNRNFNPAKNQSAFLRSALPATGAVSIWFHNLSIQQKLTTVVLLTSSIVLVLAAMGFGLYEFLLFEDTFVAESLTVAQLTGETSTAALAFGDRRAGADTLQALRADPRVLAGALYQKNGRLLAMWSRSGHQTAIPESDPGVFVRRNGETLEVSRAVQYDRENVGSVWLRTDLSGLRARLLRYAEIALAVLGIAGLVAWGIASRLQLLISRPLIALETIAARVSRDKTYQLRAPVLTGGEIGSLTLQFNEMMEQIERREKALSESQDLLEERVRRRTSELEEEIAERQRIEQSLIAAREAAEESSRAKSAFLANMSHELRTPLNAIIGYSEMLMEEEADSEAKLFTPDLKKIHGSGHHLLTLINDVLDISKIEAGRMDLNLELCAVRLLLEGVLDTIEPIARRRHNAFEVEVEDYDAIVRADVVRFRQSLLNLLSNACKFTENGTVRLKVSQQQSEKGSWLVWSIEDSGIGISEEQMARLFQPFTQADNSATRKYEGTGLGLVISRRLINLMGGHITMESKEGVGSTFRIWTPVWRPDIDDQPVFEDSLSSLAESLGRRVSGPGRILLIDDDPSSRELLVRGLQKEGFEVLPVSNGEEGLLMAAACAPAAIVLDLLMPGVDGWQVLEKLHHNPELSKVPVIVCSVADLTRPGADPIHKDAVEAILQKPVSGEVIGATLRGILARRAAASKASAEEGS